MNSQKIKVQLRKLFSKEEQDISPLEELNHWYNSLNEDVSKSISDSNRIKLQAWENIHNKIHADKVTRRRKKIGFGSWIWKAAILLLFCGAGYGLITGLPDAGTATLAAGAYSNAIGKVSAFQLPDGSKVWLSTGSKLEYAADFPTNRQVSLSGEAFFEVTTNPESPFKIMTGTVATEVLGTSFNLKSYHQSGVELSVYSGRVKFSEQQSEKESTILLMGEKISWTAQEGFSEMEQFDVAELPGWRLGKITFDNATIDMIQSTLKSWYAVTIEINGKGPNCHYTGEFTQASLEQILETLSYTLNLTYKINDANVTIDVNPC
ncbi:FecR family protein [Algoriphagus resistens]|uniref:FecR family protein n=1 Tax=Algoriphagus resistens TaxID=1750590 RepID=UPI000716B38B|nr:FecR family protein [Algoriphagus resistens]